MPRIVAEVAGSSFDGFFAKYIDGVEEVPFEAFARHAGLELKKEPAKSDGEAEPRVLAWLGVTTRTGPERPVVSSVTEASPAFRDGIYPEDEIVALDDSRVDNQNFVPLLKDRKPGDRVKLSVFRTGRLVHATVRLGKKENVQLALAPRRDAGPIEKAIYSSWLRQKWTPPKKDAKT